MRQFFFCTVCIGLRQATRVAVSRNTFCNRGSNSVTIFEKCVFRRLIKIYVQGVNKKPAEISFLLAKNPSCPALTTACGPSLSLSLSLTTKFHLLKRAKIGKRLTFEPLRCHWPCEGVKKRKNTGSTRGCSQAVPHPSTDRALCRLTSEVRRDPVHSTRYGRQQCWSAISRGVGH